MKKLLIIPFLFFFTIAFSQSSLDDLVNQIQSQELSFPFPQKDTVINVGEIDINNNDPKINYFAPVYKFAHIVNPGSNENSADWGLDRTAKPHAIIVGAEDYTTTAYEINVNKSLNFKLRFTVKNWTAASQTLSVSIGGQVQTISNGGAEIIFSNIRQTQPSVICYTNGTAPIVKRSPTITYRGDFQYLHIDWNLLGAGIIVLPVLPVKIIYAPVVDHNKSNVASMETSNAQGYNTSFSINTVDELTTPIPTAISTIDDMADDIKQIESLTDGVKDLDVVNTALKKIDGAITSALGSNTINKTVSNSVTNTQSYSISDAETWKVQAKSSNGGPGEGDVICFYTNLRLVWFESQGEMRLTVLDHDPPLKTPTAAMLKSMLDSLTRKLPNSVYKNWHLTAESIKNLLALDPFAGPEGALTQLDPARFPIAHNVDGTPAVFQNGGADLTITVMHQIQQSDFHSNVTVNSTVETDKAGFLSFLGIGETETKTMKSSLSKSSSTQQNVGQTITQSLTLNGDGKTDHYICEVYFDLVFGTFAFRDGVNELDPNNVIEGVAQENNGKILSNAVVTMQVANKVYKSRTDKNGKYKFLLPFNSQKSQAKIITTAK